MLVHNFGVVQVSPHAKQQEIKELKDRSDLILMILPILYTNISKLAGLESFGFYIVKINEVRVQLILIYESIAF